MAKVFSTATPLIILEREVHNISEQDFINFKADGSDELLSFMVIDIAFVLLVLLLFSLVGFSRLFVLLISLNNMTHSSQNIIIICILHYIFCNFIAEVELYLII